MKRQPHTQGHLGFFPMLSFSSFTVLHFTISYMIHLSYLFCEGQMLFKTINKMGQKNT